MENKTIENKLFPTEINRNLRQRMFPNFKVEDINMTNEKANQIYEFISSKVGKLNILSMPEKNLYKLLNEFGIFEERSKYIVQEGNSNNGYGAKHKYDNMTFNEIVQEVKDNIIGEQFIDKWDYDGDCMFTYYYECEDCTEDMCDNEHESDYIEIIGENQFPELFEDFEEDN